MDLVEAGVGLLAGGLLLAGVLSPLLLEEPPPTVGGPLAAPAAMPLSDGDANPEEGPSRDCPDDRGGRDACDDHEGGKGKRGDDDD